MFSECQSSKNVINIISQQKFVPASSTPDEDEVNTTNTPNDDIAEKNTTNFDNSSADDKDAPTRINKHYPTNQFLIVDEDGMIDLNTLSQPQKLDVVMELTTIKEDIRSIKNEMSNMKKEIKAQYIKINLSLDKIYQMICEKDQSVNKGARITEQTHKEDFLKKFSFPLASCQEISKLDQEIRTNCEFKSQLVEFLSQIGGVSGEKDGGKIAYKLVDSLFNPDVLVNYSWTGVSRGKTVEKKSFQSFEGILALVFEVLLLADNRHTKHRNASIFKDGVLKHAKKRSLRKWWRSKTGDDNRITVNTAEDANYDDMSGATTQDMGDEVDILDDKFEKNTENDL